MLIRYFVKYMKLDVD